MQVDVDQEFSFDENEIWEIGGLISNILGLEEP